MKISLLNKLLKIAVALTAFCVLVLTNLYAATGKNLLFNGSFEIGTDAYNQLHYIPPTGWTHTSYPNPVLGWVSGGGTDGTGVMARYYIDADGTFTDQYEVTLVCAYNCPSGGYSAMSQQVQGLITGHQYQVSYNSMGYTYIWDPRDGLYYSAGPVVASLGSQKAPPATPNMFSGYESSLFPSHTFTFTYRDIASSALFVLSAMYSGLEGVACTPCQESTIIANASLTDVTPPTITLDQRVAGGIVVPAKYSYSGTNGWATQFVTSTQAGFLGTPTPVQTLTAAGVDTVLTPTLPSGLKITNAFCSDPNYLNSGNTNANFGSFTDTTFTIPAANALTSSTLSCHVDIGFAQAKLTMLKKTATGTGSFTFNGSATNANGFSTNSSYKITTTAANQAVAGSTVTLAANNVVTEVQESAQAGWVPTGASCTDKNSSLTNNTDIFGTLNGSTLQIPAPKVAPGADLQCTFTNSLAAAAPTLTVTERAIVTAPATFNPPENFSYAGNNGWTTQQHGATKVNTLVTVSSQTLAAANVATTLTVTVPTVERGWRIASIQCTDTAAAASGNPAPPTVLASFTSNVVTSSPNYSITIPANYVVPKAALQCAVFASRQI